MAEGRHAALGRVGDDLGRAIGIGESDPPATIVLTIYLLDMDTARCWFGHGLFIARRLTLKHRTFTER